MIMVDTNIAVDLLEGESRWSGWSREALLSALEAGAVVASAVVVGELAPRFEEAEDALVALSDFGIGAVSLDSVSAYWAGAAHARYRKAGGGRERILADFFIGAHALKSGAALLTRDIRRYRTYFPELILITPETDNG